MIIGESPRHDATITITEYSTHWPELYELEAQRIRRALGSDVRQLEHVGSTSVPGLAAKPRIDICLAVADSADEPAYVPALESAGYVLRIREPDWHEHRLFKARTPMSTFTCSLRETRRSPPWCDFATDCERIPRTGSCMSEPRSNWQLRRGLMFRTMPMQKLRSSGRFSNEQPKPIPIADGPAEVHGHARPRAVQADAVISNGPAGSSLAHCSARVDRCSAFNRAT